MRHLTRIITFAGAATGVATLLAVGTASAATSSQASVTAATRVASPAAPQFDVVTYTNGQAPLFRPNNALAAILPSGTYVEITCWYYGNMPGYAADGYEDHVVWVYNIGNFTGHIPDDYIHFGGHTPPQEGLPECG